MEYFGAGFLNLNKRKNVNKRATTNVGRKMFVPLDVVFVCYGSSTSTRAAPVLLLLLLLCLNKRYELLAVVIVERLSL